MCIIHESQKRRIWMPSREEQGTGSLFLNFSGHISNVNAGILTLRPHLSCPLLINLFMIYLLSIYYVMLALISKSLRGSWGKQEEHV